jgi:hypothetical protein
MFGPFTALVGRSLADAGHDLGAIRVGDEMVSIDAFRIGRAFGRAESMVI